MRDRHLVPFSVTRLSGGLPCAAFSISMPIFSAAARCGSANMCAYRAVVAGLLWPNMLPINGKLAPDETSALA